MSTARRHQLFEAGFRAIAATGANRWLAPLTRGRGVILTFHHVRPEPPGAYAPNRLLAITPAFLDRVLVDLARRGFEVIGLDAVPERLAGTDRAPFAVLTFDDGYRDNVEHAAPVLRRHGVPWTLFVTSDFADGHGRLWWLELERAIARLDRVRLPGTDLDLPAVGAAQKLAAFEAVYRALRAGPEERLLAAIAALCQQAGSPTGALASELCLGWDALRDLARDPAVTFGAHTVSHPMLAKHDAATLRREVEPCLRTRPPRAAPILSRRRSDLRRASGIRACAGARLRHGGDDASGPPVSRSCGPSAGPAAGFGERMPSKRGGPRGPTLRRAVPRLEPRTKDQR
jgi:peptidoglycan/xylan/chitin deacetylase (PgdA/CDA1 family)